LDPLVHAIKRRARFPIGHPAQISKGDMRDSMLNTGRRTIFHIIMTALWRALLSGTEAANVADEGTAIWDRKKMRI
jgi:hypothetical protein